MMSLHASIAAAVIGCALSAAAVTVSPPAQAGPVQWCDPAAPLFDPTVCADESPGGGYSCDPFGPAYDPNYCAAQSRPSSYWRGVRLARPIVQPGLRSPTRPGETNDAR